MSKYTYQIYTDNNVEKQWNTYRKDQLEGMTTYQLQEICRTEKLVKYILNPLDKEELVRLILRYRGAVIWQCIEEEQKLGITRLNDFLTKANCYEDLINPVIQIPAKITLYESLGIDVADHYVVKGPQEWLNGNVLLVDANHQVCTAFYLKESNGVTYLCKSAEVNIEGFSKKQYYLMFFKNQESDRLFEIYMGQASVVPYGVHVCKVPLVDIRVETVPKSSSPLVIDFGTSNTTAGIYTEDASFHMIRYYDSDIIPSVIAVTGMKDDLPVFAYGQEAVLFQQKVHPDQDIPVFYDIKRFMSNPDRSEPIVTEQGIRLQIERKVLLRGFLMYIIQMAGQQFKCRFDRIQLLAPVRQKKKFSKLFKDLLPEFKVECSLDEGMAVLFHSIKKIIDQRNYEKRHWYRALIMDCGGGTTDMTSCEFKIDNNRVAYSIDMQVSYENGDTNFGGNNITYRIMQLLKIRLAGLAVPLHKESFRSIDQTGKQVIYQELEAAYQQAETIIPTKYKEYEDRNAIDYFQVKNNYYYLFEMAEKIKKEFFYDQFLYRLRITTKEEQLENMIFLDKWKLSRYEGGKLVHFGEITVDFFLYEIEELLRADIYTLMKKFLEQPYQHNDLMEYDIIKLTGQSCRSPLFMDAMREFVPGRVIQDVREGERASLKMCCLEGALSYFQSRTLGYIEANPVYTPGVLPYEVTGITHEDQDKTLIHALDRQESTSWISRFKEGNQIHFYLKDVEGNHLKVFHYNYRTEDFEAITYEKLLEKYPMKIVQDETDHIVNGETRFFVWDSRADWGFFTLPVMRDQDQLHIGELRFFDFEDDTWEMNFFDGKK